MRREARKLLWYFVWKITILRQKIIFFPILGCAPPLMMSFWFVLLGLCFLCSVLYIVVCTFLLAIVFVCPSNYDFWLPLRYLQNFSSLRFPDIYTWSVFSMVCLSTTNITIRVKLSTTYWIDWLIFGVLTPLSTIFQLYHGDQF